MRTLERKAIIGFLLLAALIPIFTPDLFPFSSMPMFSDAPQSLSLFEVYDSTGARLDESRFGLQSNYLANPAPRLSAGLPETLEMHGRLVSDEELRDYLRPHLLQAKQYRTLRIEQKIVGPFEESRGQAIGVREQRSWWIKNPGDSGDVEIQ